MAHRSWCSENGGVPSNERLEFLGDAVLGLIVTDDTYRRFPNLHEGSLAKLRAAVVNTQTLAQVAAELEIGEALLLGNGEERSGGRSKTSLLADAFEAVVGAVYLDGGWAAASAVVLPVLDRRITEAAAGPGGHDHKTRLQELAARHFDAPPVYSVSGEGPDHERWFVASVSLGGSPYGTGEGRTKKQAEQDAAAAAHEALRAETAAADTTDNDTLDTADARTT